MTVIFSAYHVLGYFLIFLLLLFYKRKPRLPLPPGPRKLPLLGNLLDFPASFEWETFQAWGKKYHSDILHLSAAGRSLIILNSVDAARDLLERRSAIYSSRSKLTIINDFMGFSWLFVFMPYGPKWKERRRLFQRHFHPSNDEIHKGKEVHYARRLLLQILETPESYMQHVRHSIGGILHSIAYGGETKPFNDPFVETAEEVSKYLSDGAVTATMIVEIVPFLLPILPYILPAWPLRKSRKQLKELGSKFRDDPFDHVKRLMSDGAAQPSFVSRALETPENGNTQHEIIKDVAALVFIGGSSTMNATLHTFFLAMLCFPDAQFKAQEEIDRVVGRGRLPEFSDQSHLPYLAALLKEVYRWRPAGPVAVPHFLENDDEYSGYHIPGQSIVMANVWAMLHDENTYPEPSCFKPDRFLKNGLLNAAIRDPATVSFGFGRRICPGAHIAESTIWIMAASILSTLQITPALDDHGIQIEPTIEYRPGVTCEPVPFKCTIQPRHDAVESLIRATIE
ncbi:hypothetical protein GALMADRAFT_101857 [Galerina marginata CBS 339.88]|uniref:Cytochrome P450 n=1 Tax=Galerina marginata (strain CBS 339.88) TaxID=685588 RepID=A0A067SRM2_GALM3|nr:hypothetical protein GALMADRAFT_101857 [Galerina marginata CBS 339.88]